MKTRSGKSIKTCGGRTRAKLMSRMHAKMAAAGALTVLMLALIVIDTPEAIGMDEVTDESITTETKIEIEEAEEPEVVEWTDAIATAYCACEKCCGHWAENRPGGVVYTASGAIAEEGVTIAADWSIYPPGTAIEIDGMGVYTVQDSGSAISGERFDIYFESHEEALQFGRQAVKIRVIEEAEL